MTQKHNLQEVLEDAFSIEELKQLCLNLEISPSFIEANATNKHTFIHNLIFYLLREGGLGDFISACKKLRPDIDWSSSDKLPEIRAAAVRKHLVAKHTLEGRKSFLDEEDDIADAIANDNDLTSAYMRSLKTYFFYEQKGIATARKYLEYKTDPREVYNALFEAGIAAAKATAFRDYLPPTNRITIDPYTKVIDLIEPRADMLREFILHNKTREGLDQYLNHEYLDNEDIDTLYEVKNALFDHQQREQFDHRADIETKERPPLSPFRIYLYAAWQKEVFAFQTFQIAVAIRQRRYRGINEPNLTQESHRAGTLHHRFPDEIIRCRITIESADCEIPESVQDLRFRADSNTNTIFFLLTPMLVGPIIILITARQIDDDTETPYLFAQNTIQVVAEISAKEDRPYPTNYDAHILESEIQRRIGATFLGTSERDNQPLSVALLLRTYKDIRNNSMKNSVDIVGSIWQTIARIVGLVSIIAILGGVVAIVWNANSQTEVNMLGAKISTGSVGAVCTFLGIIGLIFTFKELINSVNKFVNSTTSSEKQERKSKR